MTDKYLNASVGGCSGLENITISESHDSSTSIATIKCINTSKDVGDAITVNLGYTSGTTKVFSGYVKRIEKTTPDGDYTVIANDDLIRAVDFFIVGPGPDQPFTYNNITAENLIATVLGMAGLSNFNFGTTYFTFGIENPVEVNLVSSYDYARMISDIIAWSFWCDRNGVIWLRNRKPYPMDGLSGQPGDVADTSVATITDSQILDINYGFHERDLRNKIVVYGANDISVSAQSSTSYDPATGTYRQILPSGFYKAAVLASDLIESTSFAQDAANYNLKMLNKLTYEVPITIEGNPSLQARQVVTLNSTKTGYTGDWYIYQLEHVWGQTGFITSMLLRK